MTSITKGQTMLLPLAVMFTAVLLTSNTIAVKIIQVGPFIFSAATLLFPITYIFGDIFTEVYGYVETRKVIWGAIAAQILMTLFYVLAEALPAAPFWQNQEAFTTVLGVVPRVVLASLVAFFVGEFANSYVLSRMKVATKGKALWQRTIGSTIVGEGLDTLIFVTIAFAGTMPSAVLLSMMLTIYLLKVAYEILATPLTYAVIDYIKKREHLDTFDTSVSYNPFSMV